MTKTIEELTIELKSEKKKHSAEIKDLKEKISKVNSKEEPDKDETIKKLKADLLKSDVENRVGKIHAIYDKFEYKDQSSDFVDGYLAAIKVKTKGNAIGVDIPKPNADKTPKSGYHVVNESNLKKNEGEQI